MIGRGGERGSEIAVLVARHDDDDDIVVMVTDTCANCDIMVAPLPIPNVVP